MATPRYYTSRSSLGGRFMLIDSQVQSERGPAVASLGDINDLEVAEHVVRLLNEQPYNPKIKL